MLVSISGVHTKTKKYKYKIIKQRTIISVQWQNIVSRERNACKLEGLIHCLLLGL